MSQARSAPPTPVLPRIFAAENSDFADALLRDYYTLFNGRRFETLGRVWSDPDRANRVTAEDLIAVSTLSVEVPGRAAVRLLIDDSEAVSDLLRKMPEVDEPIWDVAPAALEPGSAASDLWKLLRRDPSSPNSRREDGSYRGRDGLGVTTVSKLMARKRAALIPISDSVVLGALNLRDGRGHWLGMRSLMLDEVEYHGGKMPLWKRLERAVGELSLAPTVTALRAFDVIVWYGYNPSPKTAASRDQVVQGVRGRHAEFRWVPER